MRSVVVTGSSGGLGQVLVGELLAKGHRVLALDCEKPSQNLDGVTFVHLDLADFPAVTKALRNRETEVGAVIHCAAEQPLAPAGSGFSLEGWAKTFSVNVLALEHIVSELKSDLEKTPPHRVIAIGSIHDKLTSPNMAPYSVTKSALGAWVRAAAIDLGASGISAIGISAGAIDSPKLEEGLARFPNPNRAKAKIDGLLPSGRIMGSEEIARLCIFLMAAEAVHFSGSNLTFDGGASSLLATESCLR